MLSGISYHYKVRFLMSTNLQKVKYWSVSNLYSNLACFKMVFVFDDFFQKINSWKMKQYWIQPRWNKQNNLVSVSNSRLKRFKSKNWMTTKRKRNLFKGRVHCFSMQVVKQLLSIYWKKNLVPTHLVVFEKNAKKRTFKSEKWRHRAEG